MSNSPKDYLISALKKAEPKLNRLWTEAAIGYGWDKQVHSQVSVSAGGHGLSLEYPDEIADQVHDTEYGLNGNPPKAAIRDFTHQSKPAVERAGYSALSNMLKDNGLIK